MKIVIRISWTYPEQSSILSLSVIKTTDQIVLEAMLWRKNDEKQALDAAHRQGAAASRA
jgi:hypothetical protein